jgi:hypothetical protein
VRILEANIHYNFYRNRIPATGANLLLGILQWLEDQSPTCHKCSLCILAAHECTLILWVCQYPKFSTSESGLTSFLQVKLELEVVQLLLDWVSISHFGRRIEKNIWVKWNFVIYSHNELVFYWAIQLFPWWARSPKKENRLRSKWARLRRIPSYIRKNNPKTNPFSPHKKPIKPRFYPTNINSFTLYYLL